MQERTVLSAKFDPAVKLYWLVSLLFFSTVTLVGIPLLIITIPLFFIFSSKILAAMSATITERKLVVKRGIFHKEEKSIPLEKITDVAMIQGPLMRMFKLYRLNFETAGQSSAGALVSLIGIEEAANFRETILMQKDSIAIGNRDTNPSNTLHDNDEELAALISSVRRIETLLEKLVEAKSTS